MALISIQQIRAWFNNTAHTKKKGNQSLSVQLGAAKAKRVASEAQTYGSLYKDEVNAQLGEASTSQEISAKERLALFNKKAAELYKETSDDVKEAVQQKREEVCQKLAEERNAEKGTNEMKAAHEYMNAERQV